jgi:vacuolar protein sorting-associated protein 45
MDIVQAVSSYVTKMVSAGDSAAAGTSAAKMKVLLLDNETVGLSALSRQIFMITDTS